SSRNAAWSCIAVRDKSLASCACRSGVVMVSLGRGGNRTGFDRGNARQTRRRKAGYFETGGQAVGSLRQLRQLHGHFGHVDRRLRGVRERLADVVEAREPDVFEITP